MCLNLPLKHFNIIKLKNNLRYFCYWTRNQYARVVSFKVFSLQQFQIMLYANRGCFITTFIRISTAKLCVELLVPPKAVKLHYKFYCQTFPHRTFLTPNLPFHLYLLLAQPRFLVKETRLDSTYLDSLERNKFYTVTIISHRDQVFEFKPAGAFFK